MPLNPFLRAFFRSTIPTHCAPLTDYILLVPTTDILLHSRDRESGQHYVDLVQSEEFLASHVIRAPKDEVLSPGANGAGAAIAAARENRGKARQYSTSNGRTVIIKDTWVYTNKGFRSLNQAQLQNDVLYWPNSIESQPWLIYYITRPLIGMLEHVPLTIKPRPEPAADAGTSAGSGTNGPVQRKKIIRTFDELLGHFPMIDRQMQPNLRRLFHELEASVPELADTSSGTSSADIDPEATGTPGSAKARASENQSSPSESSFVDEETMRTTMETAVIAAVDLFQRVDQSQIHLLVATTDLLGSSIEHLIERYVFEELHDVYVFPRLLVLKREQNKLLDDKIKEMEHIDIGQVGVPISDLDTRRRIAHKVTKGIEQFEKMAEARSPLKMLDILLQTAHALTHDEHPAPKPGNSINNGMREDGKDNEGANRTSEKSNEETANPVLTMNADMLVSLLLIVVIRSRVQNLQSCLTYMRNFVFIDDVETGEKGYVLSTLEGVLFHITLDSEHMGRASKRNVRLWDRIRKGHGTAVKNMVEKREDVNADSETISSPVKTGVPDVKFVGWFDDDERDPGRRQLQKRGRENRRPLESQDDDPMATPNGFLKAGEPEISDVLLSPNMDAPEAAILPEILAKIESPKDKLPELIPELELPENQDDSNNDENMAIKVDEKAMEHHSPVSDLPNGHPTPEAADAIMEEEEEEEALDTPAKEMGLPERANPVETDMNGPEPESEGEEDDLGLERQSEETGNAQPEGALLPFESGTDTPPPDILNELSKSKSVRKAKFNSEVFFQDTSGRPSRHKLNRSLSTRSDASRLSWTSTYQTTDHLSYGAPHLSDDLTSIEILTQTQNMKGESIVMMAVVHQQQDILEYLIDESTYFPLVWLLQDRSHDGTTLLSAAIQGESYDIVRVIMEEVMKAPSEDIREYMAVLDSSGRTAGHYVFNQPTFLRHFGHLIPWTTKDKNGQTPLFAICRSYDNPSYKDMVVLAVRAVEATQSDGQRLHLDDHVDRKGNTLLHIIHDPFVLKMLLRRDGDVNAVNEKNLSPLMLSSKYGRVDSVRTLFGDRRVDVYARESRGLTAVELAKDDEVRNKFDDMVMFSYPAQDDGRITAVVRGIFVEDATVRLVLKSGMPSSDMKYTITTCRRLLSDFEFLAYWLSFEHPASWLPALHVVRSPFQIPSKPSRAVLRDIQTQLDSFLRTLLSHSTFSTHELLWEFFLMPDMQPDSMMERSKRKCEIRSEKVQEEFEPVENTRDVEVFMAHARDTIRSISVHTRSVLRRTNTLLRSSVDLADTVFETRKQLDACEFLDKSGSYVRAISKYATAIAPNDSSPLSHFLDDFRSVNACLQGMMTALERPRKIISEMNTLQKDVEKHMVSLRRSDRWPLGLMDETRAKIHQGAADNIRSTQGRQEALSRELRYSQSVAAAELASFHEMHAKFVKNAVRRLARNQVLVEKERLEALKRALRLVQQE